MAADVVLPEKMTRAVAEVLGRPNFTCIWIANRLRESGQEIKRHAEDEQAAALFFLLPYAVNYGDGWMARAQEDLDKMKGNAHGPK